MPEIIITVGLLLLAFTAGFSVGNSFARDKPIKRIVEEMNDQ